MGFAFLAFVTVGLVFVAIPAEAAKGHVFGGGWGWIEVLIHGGLLCHMLMVAFGFMPLRPNPKVREKKPLIVGIVVLALAYLFSLSTFLNVVIGLPGRHQAAIVFWAGAVRFLRRVEGPWVEDPASEAPR